MATVNDLESGRISPAYVSYGTFKNFLKGIKGHMPSRIDKSVMSGLSGGTQSHLLAGLRFLDLIGPGGEPTSELEQLVEASGTDDWPDIIKMVVVQSYRDVLGDLDLTTATPQMLEEKFRAKDGGSLEGSTLTKAIRFYLAAIKEAKIEHSKRLTARKQRTSKTRRQPTQNGRRESPAPPSERERQASKNTIDYPVYFKAGRKATINVPIDLSEAECKMIELTLPLIRAYAEQMNATAAFEPLSEEVDETETE